MADPPIQYDRQFSVHIYWVSHGLLLLRSGKLVHDHKRIDILFCDVRLLGIPTLLDGLRITHHVDQEVATRLDAGTRMTCYTTRTPLCCRILTSGPSLIWIARRKRSPSCRITWFLRCGLRHTFALWQRALALVESHVVQTSLASFRAVS